MQNHLNARCPWKVHGKKILWENYAWISKLSHTEINWFYHFIFLWTTLRFTSNNLSNWGTDKWNQLARRKRGFKPTILAVLHVPHCRRLTDINRGSFVSSSSLISSHRTQSIKCFIEDQTVLVCWAAQKNLGSFRRGTNFFEYRRSKK